MILSLIEENKNIKCMMLSDGGPGVGVGRERGGDSFVINYISR